VKLTADGAVSLKDAFFATLSLIGDMFRTVAAAVVTVWDAMVSAISVLFTGFGTTAYDVMMTIWGYVKAGVNLQIAAWKTAFDAIKLIWNNFPGAMDVVFTAALNFAIAAAEKVLNAWQSPLRTIQEGLSFVDADAAGKLGGFLDKVSLTLPRAKVSAAGAQFASDFTASAAANMKRDYLGEAGAAIIARARRDKTSGGDGALDDGGKPGDIVVTGKKPKKNKGSDEETRAEYLAKVNREATNSIRLAQSMNFEWAKVDEDIVGVSEHLADKKWADLSDTERTALRQKLKAMYDEQEAQQAKQRLYEQFKAPQHDYELGQRAVNEVVAKFPQYAEQGRKALAQLREEYLQTKTDFASGLELGRVRVQNDKEFGGAARAASAYGSEYEAANGPMQELSDKAAALRQLMQDDPINSGAYSQRMRELGVEALQLKVSMPGADAFDALRGGLAGFVSDFRGMLPGLQSAFGSAFQRIGDGIANSLGRAIVYGEKLGTALKDVARSALAELIGALVKLGIQWLIQATIGSAAQAALGAASVAAGTATAAAWAPAAAMVSLASFGANAIPAAAGITAVTALTSILSKVGGAGFKEGGYTGGGGVSDVAGVVHGREFVVNAEGTRRNRALLEAMNSGWSPAGYQSGGYVGGSSYQAPASVASASAYQAQAVGGGDTFQLTIGDISSNDPQAVREQFGEALQEALPVFLDKARKQRDRDDKDRANRQRIGGTRT